MEAQVLAAVAQQRAAYDYVRSFIREDDFSERGYRIYKEIEQYYERDQGAKSVDLGIIYNRIARSLPSEKIAEQFAAALDSIAAMEVSPDNIAYEFLELRRDVVGSKLARSIEAATDREELYGLHEEYGELLDATEIGTNQEVDIDLYELFHCRLSDSAKVPLLPGVVNDLIGGGVRPGDTVVIFGRPNAGKSLFAINAASGFVRRGLRVLFIENEDSKERTLSRFVRRLIEKPEPWCISNPEQAKHMATAAGRDKFHLYKLTPGSPAEIEALVRRVQPDVLIVNQLRAIAHGMAGKLTQNLEKAAVSIRNIGQRYDLITLMVTQANANHKDREGNVVDKPILYMEDIDSSLTGIPGATDFILGVGTSRELRQNHMAVISIAKSKAKGDGEHAYVGVNPEIEKITSSGRKEY